MRSILVTGTGRSGSWEIRGKQLGAAIGASVSTTAEGKFDIAVVVKRPVPRTLDKLRSTRAKIVWDVVDAWPQPYGNGWNRAQCLAWLGEQITATRPYAIVAATDQMKEDIYEVGFWGPILTLPHHARPDQKHNAIRPHVTVIGYEGAAHYLGKWLGVLNKECAKRGWALDLSPRCLADVDIVVALRDTQGYATRNWKSNVKLANAQGSGTPFIGNREKGYVETACYATAGVDYWADTPEELSERLTVLTPRNIRLESSFTLRKHEITLSQTADTYRNWLDNL